MSPLRRVIVVLTVVSVVIGIVASPPDATADFSATNPVALTVTPVMTGLQNAWDVAFAPDGTMFVTERPGRL